MSDVNDAGNAMDFGGDGTPRSSVPWTSGEPTVQMRTQQAPGGLVTSEGKPIVETGIESGPNGEFSQITRDPRFFWNQEPTASASAGVSSQNVGASLEAGVAPYPASTGFTELAGNTYGGEPTVQTPTATPSFQSAGILDNESSLFGGNTEWWKATDMPAVTGNASAAAELGTPFGSTEATFQPASTDVGWSDPGAFDVPSISQSEPDQGPFNAAETPTGIPVEPAPINQNYEWNTSPDDRRFLTQQPTETSTDTSGTMFRGGNAIHDFGGDLTLGNWLNTPLAAMHFGEGYPAVQGGTTTTDVSQAWDAQGNPITIDTSGSTTTQGDTGWRDNAANPPFDESATPQGDFNAWPQAGRLEPNAPLGMTIVGHDTVNGQPIYRDAQGNLFVNPGTGKMDRYTGTHWNPGTGHFNQLHDPNDPAQDQSFAASKNQGAEQQSFSPVHSGQNPASDAGHIINTTGPWQNRHVDPNTASLLKAWSVRTTTAQGRASVPGYKG